MRVFLFELAKPDLREKIDQKMVEDLRECLEADELYFLQEIATENNNRSGDSAQGQTGGIEPC